MSKRTKRIRKRTKQPLNSKSGLNSSLKARLILPPTSCVTTLNSFVRLSANTT